VSTTVKELVTARVNLVKNIKEGSNLLAFATLKVADGAFAVENVRILKNAQGEPFVALPGRAKTELVKKGDRHMAKNQETGNVSEVVCQKEGWYPVYDKASGKAVYEDNFHPNTTEGRQHLNSVVLTAYAAAVAQAKANAAATTQQ
jgi:DNA-binding cell septation regulator SpoVG